jgi:hypothetical protein
MGKLAIWSVTARIVEEFFDARVDGVPYDHRGFRALFGVPGLKGQFYPQR